MKLPKTLYFEDCLKLTSIMFESNPSIYLIIDDSVFYNQREILLSWREYKRPNLTIQAINTKDFIFSIGDTVMIVDTGEIGTIEFIYAKDGELRILGDGKYLFTQRDKLVKIDPSLLTLLQD